MRIALQLHPTRITDVMLEQSVYPVLDQAGCEHYTLPRRHQGDVAILPQTDLVLVLGGDGTFLYGARLAVKHNIPILGVMIGRVGFLCGTELDELAAVINGIKTGEVALETRYALQGAIINAGEARYQQAAINDVVIFRVGTEKIRDFTARDDGKLIARYRGDGIILASATGSTAYTLAAGGPLVHPSLKVIVMTPVCAHSMFTKPLVLPPEHAVEITARENSFPLSVSFDGAYQQELQAGDKLLVRMHPTALRIYRPAQSDFYHVLRTKFQHGYLYGAEDD